MNGIARLFAWTAYDHLGGLVGYNLLWSAFGIPWIGGAYALLQFGFATGGFFLPAAFVVAGILVFGSPATVLLFVAGAAWARGRDLSLGEALMAGRTFFWRAIALGFCMVVATVLILVNMVFYQQLGGWLGALLSGLMIWFLLLVGLVAVYVFQERSLVHAQLLLREHIARRSFVKQPRQLVSRLVKDSLDIGVLS